MIPIARIGSVLSSYVFGEDTEETLIDAGKVRLLGRISGLQQKLQERFDSRLNTYDFKIETVNKTLRAALSYLEQIPCRENEIEKLANSFCLLEEAINNNLGKQVEKIQAALLDIIQDGYAAYEESQKEDIFETYFNSLMDFVFVEPSELLGAPLAEETAENEECLPRLPSEASSLDDYICRILDYQGSKERMGNKELRYFLDAPLEPSNLFILTEDGAKHYIPKQAGEDLHRIHSICINGKVINRKPDLPLQHPNYVEEAKKHIYRNCLAVLGLDIHLLEGLCKFIHQGSLSCLTGKLLLHLANDRLGIYFTQQENEGYRVEVETGHLAQDRECLLIRLSIVFRLYYLDQESPNASLLKNYYTKAIREIFIEKDALRQSAIGKRTAIHDFTTKFYPTFQEAIDAKLATDRV